MAEKPRQHRRIDLRKSPYLDKTRFARRMEIAQRAGRFRSLKSKMPMDSVAVTPVVEKFAARFSGTEASVRRMIGSLMQTIEFSQETKRVVEAHYMAQTAHDILTTKKIPVIFDKGKPIIGCNAMCIALAACLKAKGIEYNFVRTTTKWDKPNFMEGYPHSLVIFRIGKKYFASEPFINHNPMRPITQELRVQIEMLKKNEQWFAGQSPEEIGLLSIKNFWALEKEKK